MLRAAIQAEFRLGPEHAISRRLHLGTRMCFMTERAADTASWGAPGRSGLKHSLTRWAQVLFYNTVVRLLKAVGADGLFAWVTPRLETGYARASGARHPPWSPPECPCIFFLNRRVLFMISHATSHGLPALVKL